LSNSLLMGYCTLQSTTITYLPLSSDF
jgi:hypothetical protein